MPPETRRVVVLTSEAAERQFWRHVANRLALCILADDRLLHVAPPLISSDPTRPPQNPPGQLRKSHTYNCRAESIDLLTTDSRITHTTTPLRLEVWVHPSALQSVAQCNTLQSFLHDWPTPRSTEPLFPYDSGRQEFRTRPGLSGDVESLFQALLAPHRGEILAGMDGMRRRGVDNV